MTFVNKQIDFKHKIINRRLCSIDVEVEVSGDVVANEVDYIFSQIQQQVTAECHPKIDIKDYKNIPIKKEVFEISDENLDVSINVLRERNAKLVPSKLNEVGESSFVFVDYDAFGSDGKILHEITAKSYMLDLSSDNTREEFKKVLRNSKIGDERSTKIEYETNYPNGTLAGKTIIFKIRVVEIKEKELPEFNDDFARDLGTENAGDLRMKVKKSMESEEKIRQNIDVEKQIVEYLLNNNKFEVPSSLDATQEKFLIEKMKKYLESQCVSKEYIQKQIEFENGKFKEEAEKNVRLSYILNAIYKSESLVVTDSDFEIERNKIKTLNLGKENVADKYFLEKKDNILLSLKEKKLFDFLINNAKIEILERRMPLR